MYCNAVVDVETAIQALQLFALNSDAVEYEQSFSFIMQSWFEIIVTSL